MQGARSRIGTFARFATLFCAVAAAGCTDTAPEVELVGLAVLPADYFVAGPTSGQFIEAANGRIPPFVGRQPVQGFSALILGDAGTFLALPDNGYGTKENSADFLLRVYELRPDFVTTEGGSGNIQLHSSFLLADPDHEIPFPIVAELEHYPSSDIPVPRLIREGRLLTGADFDVESFRQLADGTFYFGDEFGPFLLHTDSRGNLLEPPISLPGVRSPQHPELGNEPANLPRSSGFEGMALSADGSMLFPILEHPLRAQDGFVNAYAFSLATGRYRHNDAEGYSFQYPLDPSGIAVPELAHWTGEKYLTIERDAGQGDEARFKKIFLVDLSVSGPTGVPPKTEIADLLAIADPHDLGRSGTGTFTFPFETTEAVVVIDDSTIGIINDNNYPFGLARHIDAGEPDDSEFILLRLRHI